MAEQASLSLTWSGTPEDKFSRDEAQLFSPPTTSIDRMVILFIVNAIVIVAVSVSPFHDIDITGFAA